MIHKRLTLRRTCLAKRATRRSASDKGLSIPTQKHNAMWPLYIVYPSSSKKPQYIYIYNAFQQGNPKTGVNI